MKRRKETEKSHNILRYWNSDRELDTKHETHPVLSQTSYS